MMGFLANVTLSRRRTRSFGPSRHGLRKLRWAAKGHGKSGGARIIYYFARRDGVIMLMLAYPKNEQSDLTPDQARFLLQILQKEFP